MDYGRQINMFYSIDRFEGDWAILIADDELSQTAVPREYISPDAEEGGILRYENGQYIYDTEETAARRRAVFERLKRMSGK